MGSQRVRPNKATFNEQLTFSLSYIQLVAKPHRLTSTNNFKEHNPYWQRWSYWQKRSKIFLKTIFNNCIAGIILQSRNMVILESKKDRKHSWWSVRRVQDSAPGSSDQSKMGQLHLQWELYQQRIKTHRMCLNSWGPMLF